MKKRTLALVVSLASTLGFVSSCGETPTTSATTTVEEVKITLAWQTTQTEWAVGDTNTLVATVTPAGTTGLAFSSSATSVATIDATTGAVEIVGLGDVTFIASHIASGKNASLRISVTGAEKANGAISYAGLDYDGRAEILGALEDYAVKKHLTGTTLYENGGYVLYNPRVTKGTETYITNYGFGTMSEGRITADLEGETNPAYKRFYHTYQSEDPSSINSMDANGSLISDLYGNASASYWSTKMNETKDGYVWYSQLAKGDPIAGERDANGLTTSWKVYVKTEADGLYYGYADNGKFANKWGKVGVQLADYVNAYRVLLNQSYGLFRSAENASTDGDSVLQGAATYYKATETNADEDGKLFASTVTGLKSGTDDGGSYLQFNLVKPCNDYYARYYLNTYNPLPQEFLNDIGGVSKYGVFNADNSTTPADNFLSVGPYKLNTWESDVRITFKRNPDWIEFKDPELKDRYSIEGIHIAILTAIQNDPEAALKEFELSKLDSCSVPSTKVKEYANDPRATQTKGDSTFKLNFNALTQELHDEIFPRSTYVCKPIMGNDSFLKGLEYSIDRKQYATNRGVVPSQNFFSSAYLSNPEEGISYNDTQYHKNVIAKYSPETSGFNLETSKSYFKKAVEELVEDGSYELGTKDNPTNVTVNITWMVPSQITSDGTEVEKYIEDAFNDDSVCGGKLVLDVTSTCLGTDYTLVYDAMKAGEFDIGFGSITGMQSNPLAFIEVLKSDNSTGFTLNWGADTSKNTDDIIYDGKSWSFDALWTAGTVGGIFAEGENIQALTVDPVATYKFDEEQNFIVTVFFDAVEATGFEWSIEYVYAYSYSDDEVDIKLPGSFELVETETEGRWSVTWTISKDWWQAHCVDKETGAHTGVDFDICFSLLIAGTPATLTLWTDAILFPIPAA